LPFGAYGKGKAIGKEAGVLPGRQVRHGKSRKGFVSLVPGIVMLADEVDVLCIKVLCQWKKLHQKGDPD